MQQAPRLITRDVARHSHNTDKKTTGRLNTYITQLRAAVTGDAVWHGLVRWPSHTLIEFHTGRLHRWDANAVCHALETNTDVHAHIYGIVARDDYDFSIFQLADGALAVMITERPETRE